MNQAAQRYAQALFDTACEQNNLESVQAAMTSIGNLMLSVEDFRKFLYNPSFSFEEHSSILKALFEGRIPDIVYKFLLFVTHKNRLKILKDIIDAFDGLYMSSTKQLRALIETALPVNEADKTFISGHLQDKLHLRMVTQWELKPSLLGGFRIYAQGRIYDYSFKSQLNHFIQQTTQLV